MRKVLENRGAAEDAEQPARREVRKDVVPETTCGQVPAPLVQHDRVSVRKTMASLGAKPDHSNRTFELDPLCAVSEVSGSLQ